MASLRKYVCDLQSKLKKSKKNEFKSTKKKVNRWRTEKKAFYVLKV